MDDTIHKLKLWLGPMSSGAPPKAPTCQHRPLRGRPCGRQATVEFDPGPDGQRPRWVCRRCLPFQVAAIGPITNIQGRVKFTAEGGFRVMPANEPTVRVPRGTVQDAVQLLRAVQARPELQAELERELDVGVGLVADIIEQLEKALTRKG